MSELHKFIFDGLPVRGMLVRLTSAWTDLLARRAGAGAYPAPVRELLGEMAAAGVLMQGNIKFNGALTLQIFGDGPVRLAVVEVQSDLSLRGTAKVVGEVAPDARLSDMVNQRNQGRCAITLDPRERLPGQQPYQGVVSLHGDQREPLQQISAVLQHYMLQSEQLDTLLVLAANDEVAAGLLIQRLPTEGEKNLGQWGQAQAEGDVPDPISLEEHFNRIATLAASLRRDELLTLDADTLLRRLFWQEPLTRQEPLTGARAPRFACSCSRERVAGMLRGLGPAEAEDILAEQGRIEVGCDFCGAQYRFDAVDAARLFTPASDQPPASASVQ